MATRTLVDGNTELTAKGIISIYKLTGICAAILDANGLQELITKFPTLTTPFKHSDEIRHTAKHYITTSGPPTHASPRRLHPEKYKIAKDKFQHVTIRHYTSFKKSILLVATYGSEARNRRMATLWGFQEPQRKNSS